MNPLLRWGWWRTLQENPVYLREKGQWGNPNPFYERLRRYSPFIILGAVITGFCAGGWNVWQFGYNDLAVLWCLICLPNIFLNALTMFGSLMAPALTAPSISLERDRGTWEILRSTPLSIQSIAVAKLLGAMARLRIWRLFLAASLLQGLLIACSASLTSGSLFLTGLVAGAAAVLRPWLEVLFAGSVGMYVSVRVRSATMALAASYAAVIGYKLVNSSSLWMGTVALLGKVDLSDPGGRLSLAGAVGPVAVYGISLAGIWLGLMRQVEKLSYGHSE